MTVKPTHLWGRDFPNTCFSRGAVKFHKQFTASLCHRYFLCDLIKRIVMLLAAIVIYPILICIVLPGTRFSHRFTKNVETNTIPRPLQALSVEPDPVPQQQEETTSDIPETPQKTIEPVLSSAEKARLALASHMIIPETVVKALQRQLTGNKDENFSKTFNFPSLSKLAFKVSPNNEELFVCIETAQEVKQQKQLDLLIIPRAKLFEVTNEEGRKFCVLAEEQLNCDPDPDLQQTLYETHAERLVPLIKQLTILVFHTGIPLTWKNIPLLEEKGSDLPTRAAIVNLPLPDKGVIKEIGLFGQADKAGLIRCCNTASHIEALIEEAQTQGITMTSPLNMTVQKRQEELQYIDTLQAWHKEKGITEETSLKSLKVDLKALKVNLKEEGCFKQKKKQKFTLQQAIQAVVDAINRKLGKQSHERAGLRFRRHIELHIDKDPFLERYIKTVYHSGNWCDRVVQLLQAKGHIFFSRCSTNDPQDRIYYIQI